MLTQRRCSFSTVPDEALTTIQGALGVTENETGLCPRLKTSTKWLCLVKVSNPGSAAPEGELDEYASREPSTATPKDALAGSWIPFTSGMMLVLGSLHVV